jgi:hypothetical protein
VIDQPSAERLRGQFERSIERYAEIVLQGRDLADRTFAAVGRPRKQAKFSRLVSSCPPRTGRVVQLTGSVIENSHGLHWNTFKSSPIVRLIARNNIIERPQTGQMTSMGAGSIIRTPA